MPELPLEIWTAIAGHVRDPSTYGSLARTCVVTRYAAVLAMERAKVRFSKRVVPTGVAVMRRTQATFEASSLPNGDLHGVFRLGVTLGPKTSTGNPVYRGRMCSGVLHGNLSYYAANGTREFTMRFDNGVLTRFCKYDAKGVLLLEAECSGMRMTSIHICGFRTLPTRALIEVQFKKIEYGNREVYIPIVSV